MFVSGRSHVYFGSVLILGPFLQSETRPSTQDVPSQDPGTAGPVPVPLHSASKVFIHVTTKTKFYSLIS